MSDLETQIRGYSAWLADAADAAARNESHDDADTGSATSGSPHRRRWVVLAAAAAVVTLVVGLAAVARVPSGDTPADVPPNRPAATTTTIEQGAGVVTLGNGYDVAVIGDPVDVNGVQIWRGQPAPELTDSARAELTDGEVIDLEPLEPGEVILDDEFIDGGPDRMVTVGRNGNVMFLAHGSPRSPSGPEPRCVLVAPDDTPTDWLGGCGAATGTGTVLVVGGPAGYWIVWTDIPADTAIVELRGADGATTQQRPVARTVVFRANVLGETADDLAAIDVGGNIVAVADSPTSGGSDEPETTGDVTGADVNVVSEVLAAAAAYRLFDDNSFGGQDVFDRVNIVDSYATADTNGFPVADPESPLPLEVRAAIEAALAPLAVAWVSSLHDVIGNQPAPGASPDGALPDYQEVGAVLTLGAPNIEGDDAEVPSNLWCGGRCGIGSTHVLERSPSGDWAVTGTTGKIWIS